MKILFLAATAILLASCNNHPAVSDSNTKVTDSTNSAAKQDNPVNGESSAIQGIISGYLTIKNALVNDNSKEAAAAGKTLQSVVAKVDKATLSAEQKKVFDAVADDLKENAEHIGANAGKLDHQREHFEMLSQDVYDLVKAFGTEETLYKTNCPMYNNGKGANWLSESKDVKNPYMGKEMTSCGEVKEELKKK
jgi:hypothetical protein